MTFSLVARCEASGMVGVAIASSSPAVAARCAFTRAGVGAVASQNVTDPRLGPQMLDLMAAGRGAADALAHLQGGAPFMAWRQVLAVDRTGAVAVHSGSKTLGLAAEARGRGVAAAGNLLADRGVPEAMARAFERAADHLGDRLVAGLRAGRDAGGEAGPVHSAGLQICDRMPWPVADLRCDWTGDDPIEAVAAAWAVYGPQIDDYVRRALDPRDAPAYGVPGDEG